VIKIEKILTLALLSFVATQAVFAGDKAKDPKVLQETLAVDCNAGDLISDALASQAVELTIEISGICFEDVVIRRSRVTLIGTDPSFDGIRAALDEPPSNSALEIQGSNRITIQNLSLGDADFGIGMNYSFGLQLIDSVIDNTRIGVIIGSASGSSSIMNSQIVNSVTRGSVGMLVSNGSAVRCTACRIENFGLGLSVRESSSIDLENSDIVQTRRAADISTGSRLATSCPSSSSGLACLGNTLEGETITGWSGFRGAFRVSDNSSANLTTGEDRIHGRIEVLRKSVVSLNGSAQLAALFENSLSGSSTLTANNATVLLGDYELSEFSNATLTGGTSLGGTLECSSGADAYCINPADINGGAGSASCGQCMVSP
jgi:hypothetical protein